jgi:hypothetical protein
MLVTAAVLVACACDRAGSATGPQPGSSVVGGWVADSLTGTDSSRTGFELRETASGVITGKVYTPPFISSNRPLDDVTGMHRDGVATLDWTATYAHITSSY